MKIFGYAEIISNTEAKVGHSLVKLSELKELVNLIESYKPEFAIGDYVRINNNTSRSELIGKCGKIVNKRMFWKCDCKQYLVEFAENLNEESDDYIGAKYGIPKGHCRVFKNNALDLVDKKGES